MANAPWQVTIPRMLAADYRDADAELAATLATCIREGARVLEAGGGSLSHVCLPPRAHITVIDLSPEQLVRNHYADVKVQGDLHTHEFAPDSFDVILCWDVIEHLENPRRVFESFVRWVRPGGVIVIAAPNPRSLSGQITKHTPHWFHVWVLRHVFRAPRAGEPGVGPFPTFMDPAMYPEALAGLVRERGLRLVHMRCYASGRLEHLQQQRPLLGRVFTTTLRALRAASRGRWQPEQSDFHLIAQKPP